MKNIDELREIVTETLLSLKKKEMTHKEVNAVASLTGRVISGYKDKLQYHKLRQEKPKIEFYEND